MKFKNIIGKFLNFLLCILLVITIVGCKNNFSEVIDSTDTSTELQLLKSDLKLTQEQVQSQIKAEYLIENNGYKDSDEVVLIVTSDCESLIDLYNNKYYNSYSTIADFAASKVGENYLKDINDANQKLLNQLYEENMVNEVVYEYNTLFSGVAVKTSYGNLDKISSFKGVSNTILSDEYNLPATSTVEDTSSIINAVNVYDTGIYDSSSVSYDGSGTAVAILDSGFDMSHTVFQNQPSKLLITQKDVTKVLAQTKAAEFTTDIELFDVYYSKKIPFYYDYADKDTDVFPYDSEHGTHVAGIIGGSDDTITGVAVNTQLVLMKVFPDLDSGGKTEDIMAALEDAVLLGVDCINMSLGSSCGFAREEDGNAINDIYDKINESGISLLTAASNSYSSGYGGSEGNTNYVTNPDSGTVGSPSTYEAALSVASISGVKSKYLVANDSQVVFFTESNSISGDENDFFEELGITEGVSRTYEYVTVPGVGLNINYSDIDVEGKIALIRRGDNTFEEKALYAKEHGAVACIIYNNIDGDIIMSMGKTDHIPTISISKDNGEQMAEQETGTITISYSNQAGPFMNDFSSWGPTPSLGIKPEITAHGGTIKSAVPGGSYDELSGTSMATPNLCGVVVLIRQYLKETYPSLSVKEISVLCNELLMSTATIAVNEEGSAYSPRKQGAGLADLYKAVTTKGYLTVDGIDRTKLELGDDADRTGVYEMDFNVVNLSLTESISYDLGLIAMSESVSTYNTKHVAETAHYLTNNFTVTCDGGTLDGNTLTVEAGSTVKVHLVYTLDDSDKEYIDSLFPYGMYVEGFVTLENCDSDGIDLNIPYLAFYGDWTEAPMFDKTYYEVEAEAYDNAIDDDDKIKADYYATTPYGSYYYNYMIPLGTYLYDIDEDMYDKIPASEDHIAISNYLGVIDGISSIYAGLLRNAKTMTFTITDKVTGEVMYESVDYNAVKAYAYNGTPIPYYNYLKIKSSDIGLINNRQYEFKMEGLLDYGDGGVSTNVRNTYSFDFYLDDEAPIIKSCSYEKVYDKSLKKDRYYLTMTVYDNQYVQSITPLLFTSTSTYTTLTENPIPVYSEKGCDNVVRFEITDLLEEIENDQVLASSLAFSIDDYALNSNIFLCQLPGTCGDFKFTKDGSIDGIDLNIVSLYEGEVVDLVQFLATSDETVDTDKDYLKYLDWSSSNENVATVEEGIVKCLSYGKATITVTENMDGKKALLIINVKKNPESEKSSGYEETTIEESKVDELRFNYFETLFAYSRAAQTSEIGSTGSKIFMSSLSELSFYPGESIQLFHDFDPWYAEENYTLSYKSTNPSVATVDENGVVKGLKKGTTRIVLSLEGSNIQASVKITIKSEFVIESRVLVAYKGLGGEVTIPDDEGIMYIGSYAFCLYDTDYSIELSDDDYDANKIPNCNTSVTKVIIPKGVTEVQKYAFYNCSNLKEVVLPEDCKYVREYAFYGCEELYSINLENVEVVGKYCFYNNKCLKEINWTKLYAIGACCFDGSGLTSADLSHVRNVGNFAFRNCTNLESVVMNKDTAVSVGMFVNTGLKEIDIYEADEIPMYFLAKCENLERITLHNDLVYINYGAFCQCPKLETVEFKGTVDHLGSQVFYDCDSLREITLPNSSFSIGEYCFYDCNNLEKVIFSEFTYLNDISGAVFEDTNIKEFVVDSKNKSYKAKGNYVVDKDLEIEILFAKTSVDYGDLVIPDNISFISNSAFAGCKMTSVTFENTNICVSDYAFCNCEELESITFNGGTIGKHSFTHTTGLVSVTNLETVKSIGDYAFSNTSLTTVSIGDNTIVGEGAFYSSGLTIVTLGNNVSLGMGAFQSSKSLVTVNMPDAATISIGEAAFANCIKLKNIDLTKAYGEIGDEAFYDCESLLKAELENITVVGAYAFADCSALAKVTIPNVCEIKEGAFSRYSTSGGAPTFESITLPETLTTIGDGAFLGCAGLSEIVIPEGITSIGEYAFCYNTNLVKVVLPSTVKEIGTYAFAASTNLSDINLSNVEKVYSYAFYNCTSLANVDLSNVCEIEEGGFAQTIIENDLNMPKLTILGDYAFNGNLFEEVVCPSLTTLGEGAFYECSNLTTFSLSSNIEFIDQFVFNKCSSLESITFNGELNGIINDYCQVIDGVLYTTLESGHLELKVVPSCMKIEKLVVVEDTYRIDTYAGCENPYISYIELPDSLKLIGNYAFYGYSNLSTVEFKSVTAPSFEDWYNSSSAVSEDDIGYDLLHNTFDVFGFELYYYNFVDLLGVAKQMTLVLPNNAKLTGYDSTIFEGYFDNTVISDYTAMEENLVTFLSLGKKIKGIENLTLADEDIVKEALTAYNAITQDYSNYGITQEEYEDLANVVKSARTLISELKLKSGGQTIIALQEKIDNLPTTFDISLLDYLHELHLEINSLRKTEKNLLDLTNYTKLQQSYNEYITSINTEFENVTDTVNRKLVYTLYTISTLAVVAGAIFLVFIKKGDRD